MRSQDANVHDQRQDITPPTEAPYQANFYEQADHVPTERPPDSTTLQVHRAEAIIRASTDDVPAGGNSIFRAITDPSRFAAHSTNTTNRGEGKVRFSAKTMIDRLRPNKNSSTMETNMAVIIQEEGRFGGKKKEVINHSPTMIDIDGINRSPAMIDGGSNCSIANDDMRLLSYVHPERAVSISGIGGSIMNNLRIGSFATVTHTEDGERVLLIFHEYAHLTEGQGGRSIHSAIHLRDGGSIVNDTPIQLGGTQNITTPGNRVIPLFFTNGIPCMSTEYPSDEDLDTLHSIVMNRDEPWTPQQHDHDHDNQWYGDADHGEHEEQSQATPPDQPVMNQRGQYYGDVNTASTFRDARSWRGHMKAHNHQEHSSTVWTRAQEAEMLRLSKLGLPPNPSVNIRHNFVFKMKSDGRTKCRATVGSNRRSITRDTGSSKCGLRDNFTEVLKEIGFSQCSSTPDVWTRSIDDRLDRVVTYCDDLIITSWNPELLEDILTIRHEPIPMQYDSQQDVE